MKYLPTVNLWDAMTITAIRNGQLKLQVGQWCKCGADEKQLSRFISVNRKSGTVNVAHGSNNKEVIKKFNARINLRRDTIARFGRE